LQLKISIHFIRNLHRLTMAKRLLIICAFLAFIAKAGGHVTCAPTDESCGENGMSDGTQLLQSRIKVSQDAVIDVDHMNISFTVDRDGDPQKAIEAAIEKAMQTTGRHWIISDGEIACKVIGNESETCSLPLETAPDNEDGDTMQTEAVAQIAQSVDSAPVIDDYDDTSETYQVEDKESILVPVDKGLVTSPAALLGSSGKGRKARKITDQEEKDAIAKVAEDMEDDDTREKWNQIDFYKDAVGYAARGILIGIAHTGESTCMRESKGKKPAFGRRAVWKCRCSWGGCRCGCPKGWENPWWSRAQCIKPCNHYSKCNNDCNTHGWICHHGCNGWEDDGSSCWKPCKDGFTQFDHECGETGYCSQDAGSCAAFVGNVIVDAGMVAASMIPGSEAVVAAKTAARTAAKAGQSAARASVKTLLKEMAKDFIKDAAVGYLKSQLDGALKLYVHGITDSNKNANALKNFNIFAEANIQRAAESVGAQVISNFPGENADLRWVVTQFNGVDPTGVMGLVNTLWKGDCADQRVGPATAENPATCGNPNPWNCDYAFMLAKGFAAIPCPDPKDPDSCTNAVCCVTDPSKTTTTPPPPGTCEDGYHAEWSAGSSKYICSRCYGSTRRRLALRCTACPSGKVAKKGKDDCVNGGPPPLKKTCTRHSDCYDDYWKWPNVLCTNKGCKEQVHRRRRR
jgi:hypothetical protein